MEKSILITGCSHGGIGYHAAKILRERGWRVFVSARKPEDVEKLKAEGFEALHLRLEDSNDIENVLAWIQKHNNGKLGALFNNAAFTIPAAIEDLSRDAMRYQFEGCFFGWHELTLGVLKIMRAQGFGRIVQNSSVLGLIGMRFRGAYSSCKFALEGYSDILRLELVGTNIYVSLIEPGPIRSNFRKNAFTNYEKWIEPNKSQSHYKEQYESMVRRFQSNKPEPFTLGAEAVVEKLIHALESPKPKPRYYVTKATWLLASLRRFLPAAWCDKFLIYIAKKEQQRY